MEFSKRGQEVKDFAEREARVLNHPRLDGHHVLVGIVKKGTGVAAQELLERNVNLDALRVEVRKIVPPGSGPKLPSEAMLFQEPQLRDAIECAEKWVVALKDEAICPIHLLLAMMEVCDVHVLRILGHFNIKPSELADTVLRKYEEKKLVKRALALRDAFAKKIPGMILNGWVHADLKAADPLTIQTLEKWFGLQADEAVGRLAYEVDK